MKSDINDKETLVNEIQFMRMCKHPNVIAYVESYLVGGSLWVRCEVVILLIELSCQVCMSVCCRAYPKTHFRRL